MCTLEVNSLELFDIHNIKTSSEFKLHASSVFAACQAQSNLLTFCLLPPTTRLEMMCNTSLIMLFNDTLDGKYTTLDSMPLIWDTVEDPVGNLNNWIDIPNGNVTQLYNTEPYYLGLQPLPPFVTMAFSDNQIKMLGVFGGLLYETDAKTGFVVKRTDINGMDDSFQSVVINAQGTMGMVLFSDKLYAYFANTFFNITTVGYKYQFVQMFNNNNDDMEVQRCVVVATNSTTTSCIVSVYLANTITNEFQLVKTTTFAIPNSSLVQWCCVFPTKEVTLIAFDNFSGPTYPVYNFNNTIGNTTPPELTWNVTRFGFFPSPPFTGRWTAVARINSIPTAFTVLACNRVTRNLFQINLDATSDAGDATLISNTTLQVIQDLNFTYLCYIATNQLFAVFLGQFPPTFINAHGNNNFQISNESILAFNASGRKTWVYNYNPTGGNNNGNGNLYQNMNSSDGVFGDNFVFLFDLYVNRQAQVSDYGMLNDNTLPQPVITWFFGYRIFQDVIVPGTVITSPHQYFRLVVGSEVINDQPNAFAHVTVQLQRANLTAMLQNNQGGFKLYDNADASIGDVIWRRFTTDQWSSTGINNSFAEFKLPFIPPGAPPALVSPNGLYILYKSLQNGGLRVVYNIYNSASFAEFCIGNPERTARGIQRMQEFCFSQLQETNNGDYNFINPSSLFKDKRCSCIAGEKFASDIIKQEGLDIYLSATTRAQFIDNLPCLLNSCQETLATPEQTLVYNVTKAQCQNADLTVCSSVLYGTNPDDPSQITTRQGVISQTCGGNLKRCGQDALCPEGSYCVDGTCLKKCSNDTQCAIGAQCKLGVCIAPAPTESNQTSQIVLIILSVLIIVFIIILIFVVLKKKKKKQQQQQQQQPQLL